MSAWRSPPVPRGQAELRAGDRLIARVGYELTTGPAAGATRPSEALLQLIVELADLFDYAYSDEPLALVFGNGARWPVRLEPIFGAAGDLSCFTYRAHDRGSEPGSRR